VVTEVGQPSAVQVRIADPTVLPHGTTDRETTMRPSLAATDRDTR
jgi:hypothetical protein